MTKLRKVKLYWLGFSEVYVFSNYINRVVNFLKRWVSSFSFDFRGNSKLVERLVTVCRSTFVNNEKVLGETIIRTLEEQLKV